MLVGGSTDNLNINSKNWGSVLGPLSLVRPDVVSKIIPTQCSSCNSSLPESCTQL